MPQRLNIERSRVTVRDNRVNNYSCQLSGADLPACLRGSQVV